jgi:PTS system fructose-specific IIC component
MVLASVPTVPCAPLDVVELRHRRRESVLIQMIAAAQSAGAVREPEVLLASLARAHKLASPAIGHGCAVPHARSISVLRPAMVFGRSGRGIDWDAADADPVQLVLLVLSPAAAPLPAHLDRVAAAVHALRLQRTRQKLLDARDADVRTLLAGTPA